jgi:hypothetical protein
MPARLLGLSLFSHASSSSLKCVSLTSPSYQLNQALTNRLKTFHKSELSI